MPSPYDSHPNAFARPFYRLVSSALSPRLPPPSRGCICGASTRYGAVVRRFVGRSHVSYLYSHLHLSNGVCLRSGGGRGGGGWDCWDRLVHILGRFTTSGMRWIRPPRPHIPAHIYTFHGVDLCFSPALWQRSLKDSTSTRDAAPERWVHTRAYIYIVYVYMRTAGVRDPVKRNERIRRASRCALSDVEHRQCPELERRGTLFVKAWLAYLLLCTSRTLALFILISLFSNLSYI